MGARDEAKELLWHYLDNASGGSLLSADCRSEVESIVDRIIDAAVEAAKAESE